MDKTKLESNNPARPYVGFTRKFNLGNYQSLDINVGLSDDAKPGETQAQALVRVTKTVLEQFEELCEKFEGKAKTKGGK